ncbi:hypothetical protein M0R72_07645 [Candidatus Pacearchaeota archaeon]|nr:hypothetical protein [Candidatus Pacearchaeota archaeon]
MDSKFWVVIKQDTAKRASLSFNPRVYPSVGEAKNEAERLCRKERCKFFVLEVIAAVEPETPPIPPVIWKDITKTYDGSNGSKELEECDQEDIDDIDEEEDDEAV